MRPLVAFSILICNAFHTNPVLIREFCARADTRIFNDKNKSACAGGGGGGAGGGGAGMSLAFLYVFRSRPFVWLTKIDFSDLPCRYDR